MAGRRAQAAEGEVKSSPPRRQAREYAQRALRRYGSARFRVDTDVDVFRFSIDGNDVLLLRKERGEWHLAAVDMDELFYVLAYYPPLLTLARAELAAQKGRLKGSPIGGAGKRDASATAADAQDKAAAEILQRRPAISNAQLAAAVADRKGGGKHYLAKRLGAKRRNGRNG
jgi:hypothetical protein